MKAAVVTSFTEPLRVEERDVPAVGPEQVLVRIETSGLCHTDIHAARGDWPVKPSLPFVPGHEGIGVVAAKGDLVDHLRIGDRVAIAWLAQACGRCEGEHPTPRRQDRCARRRRRSSPQRWRRCRRPTSAWGVLRWSPLATPDAPERPVRWPCTSVWATASRCSCATTSPTSRCSCAPDCS